MTPKALQDASVFAGAVQSFVAENSISQLKHIPSIFVTGFSLGGAEAEEAALDLSSGISGGETFGAPGLPNYSISSVAESSSFVNYVNFGDIVANWGKDTELSSASLTGAHFGSIQYVGNTLDQNSLRTAAHLLHSEEGLAGAALWTDNTALLAAAAGTAPALAQAIEQSFQETLSTHSLEGSPWSYSTYVAPSLTTTQQYAQDINFASTILPQLAQNIALQTQPSGTPLPPPVSAVYSIAPNSPMAAENSGTLTFTITRDDTSQSATVYVSTIQDQGFLNVNGNEFYDGLLNDKFTFDAGVATAQVQLTINDQQLTSGSETFRVAVQQNATDPIGTYLATTNFTIENTDPIISAHRTFDGGGGDKTIVGTSSNLDGDTINNLSLGDTIIITDASLAHFSFQQSPGSLKFDPDTSISQTSSTINLSNTPAGQFAISADPVSGVDLTFVPSFVFTTINFPSLPAGTQLAGINDEGQIVGSIPSSGETSTGFLDVGGTFTTIAFSNNPDYELASGTEATGINNSGLIVGTYQVPSGYGGFYEFGYSYLASSDFYFPPFDAPNANGITFAAGMNDGGQIVGYSAGEGFLDTGGTFTTIEDPLGIAGTSAAGINNLGQIVGDYYDSGSGPGEHGFLDTNGIFTTIDDPQAVNGTVVTGINNVEQIVGYYIDANGVTHGFIDSGGTFTTVDDPNATTGTFIQGINDKGEIVGYYRDADGTHGFTAETACYCAGTRILTERGEVPIESLATGMKLVTSRGEARPLIWRGHRTIDCTKHPRPHDVWPVRVEAGAFGGGKPQRDLWLSPAHSVFTDGVLIPIRRLINGATIAQLPVKTVTYFHVELENHDVVLAEGLPAETYLDTGNRASFVEGGDIQELYPDFLPKHAAGFCAPLHEFGSIVASVKTRLLAQAQTFGYEITTESDLHIIADGQRVAARMIDGGCFCFDMPGSCEDIRLMSRCWVPAHVAPESGDVRELGVCVHIVIMNGQSLRLDDSRLGEGWHDLENGLDSGHRWTTGAARLPAGAKTVAIGLCGAPSYWLNHREHRPRVQRVADAPQSQHGFRR